MAELIAEERALSNEAVKIAAERLERYEKKNDVRPIVPTMTLGPTEIIVRAQKLATHDSFRWPSDGQDGRVDQESNENNEEQLRVDVDDFDVAILSASSCAALWEETAVGGGR